VIPKKKIKKSNTTTTSKDTTKLTSTTNVHRQPPPLEKEEGMTLSTILMRILFKLKIKEYGNSKRKYEGGELLR